ncbi:MAG: zinc-binding dehydrogenase [Actinomycetota bacterium]
MRHGHTHAALVVEELGRPPVLRRVNRPDPAAGGALVRLRAAGLNPADLAIGAGRFYLPLPDPPFVAGCEAVGEVIRSGRHPEGARVWCLQPTGCFAEVFTCPEDALVPVPDGVSDAVAVAMGVAGLAGWMPVRDRGALRAGETVLVLGAGGVVGRVAVQAARAGGAARVVAGVRSEAGDAVARAAGADEVVRLGGDGDAAAFRRAAPDGVDLVVDTLWGAPLVAALGALAPRARIVQVGSGAGAEAAFPAGPLRGGRIDIRGFSVFSERPGDLARAYIEAASAAARGEVRVDTAEVPLADGPAAWARLAAGTSGVKVVLTA